MAKSFQLWQDQAMTIPLPTVGGLPSIPLQYSGVETLITNVWFGSPIASRTLEPQASNSSGKIILSVGEKTQVWAASTAYTSGNIVQSGGFMYRATRSGTTGATAPLFPITVGDGVSDGSLRWENAGIAFDESNIKLALSEAEAQSSTSSSLDLGVRLTGGVAIAVWIKAANANDVPRSDTSDPTVRLNINKVIESA